jgi:hypothetical protein
MSESQVINTPILSVPAEDQKVEVEVKVAAEVAEEEAEDEVDAFYNVEITDKKDYAEYPDDSAYYEQHDDDEYEDYEYDAGLDWNESGYFD